MATILITSIFIGCLCLFTIFFAEQVTNDTGAYTRKLNKEDKMIMKMSIKEILTYRLKNAPQYCWWEVEEDSDKNIVVKLVSGNGYTTQETIDNPLTKLTFDSQLRRCVAAMIKNYEKFFKENTVSDWVGVYGLDNDS